MNYVLQLHRIHAFYAHKLDWFDLLFRRFLYGTKNFNFHKTQKQCTNEYWIQDINTYLTTIIKFSNDKTNLNDSAMDSINCIHFLIKTSYYFKNNFNSKNGAA